MLKRAILRDAERSCWLVFEQPGATFVANAVKDVLPALRDAETTLEREGGFIVGYASFDAAPAFDRSFEARRDDNLPLVCFGHFSNAEQIDTLPTESPGDDGESDWVLSVDEHEYEDAIQRIHTQIAAGNTYQINYTVRYHSTNPPAARRLFSDLGQKARYGALLEFDSHSIVSASPELFFRLDGNSITCRPMKGTAMRGLSRADDLARRDDLARSEKDRAENIMITDMVRNDLGRIAEPGSVRASELCAVEQHPTVWQMTSTVEATTNAGLTDIFSALFPSASITGAPKSSSLRLIHELEKTPRGIYTGAIGYFAADRKAQFNVAIRTAQFDHARGVAEYGVGSGIIWDSVAADEFRECQLKAEILQRRHRHPEFALLETMLWRADRGVELIDYHVARLQRSADYFDRSFDAQGVSAAIDSVVAGTASDSLRLRLLVDESGAIRVETATPPKPVDRFRVRLARRPVNSGDPFLYHKTTHRAVYRDAVEDLGGCDDVLLWNENGLITETTIANVFLRDTNGLKTPPVHCGLLSGVLRQSLLDNGSASEAEIHKDEIQTGQELLLTNAIRGRFKAVVID